MFEKVEKGKKNHDWTGQPRTCNHLINAQTLTGICQVVRMFYNVNYIYTHPKLDHSCHPLLESRHTVVCRAAQEAGALRREYIYRKKVNVVFTPL